ncbi:hypothetical protein MMC14_004723 [Varicellaria rhodocarpa]|nr:hypothetical protein [Varicellaria rhodocarpa]
MSSAAKFTLAGTSAMAATIVIFVHYAQRSEKAAMHAGVLRDVENQRVKKERQAEFEMQRALEQEYRKVQSVHDGSEVEGRSDGTG